MVKETKNQIAAVKAAAVNLKGALTMGLFSKKEEKKESCCCADCTPEKMEQAEAFKSAPGVKVLGSGCVKCNALEAAAKEALAELNMDTNIEHVTDFEQIAAYGVMSTPALVINDKVVSVGKVLKKDEVITILNKLGGKQFVYAERSRRWTKG
ncbi:thioredoxin family protein [Synergistes jonesii]|nr:thioredoxin family protein [Synergistes jonesii]